MIQDLAHAVADTFVQPITDAMAAGDYAMTVPHPASVRRGPTPTVRLAVALLLSTAVTLAGLAEGGPAEDRDRVLQFAAVQPSAAWPYSVKSV